MKDPHVEVLYHEFLSLDSRHDYSQAAAWQGNLGGFDCRLADGQLEARPQGHYPDVQSARDALEPHLRDWVLWSELHDNIRIGFVPGGARVVDRTSGAVAVEAQAASAVGIAGNATVRLGHGSYPSPAPSNVSVSPLVSELMGWVRALREHQHPMLVTANLFQTRLENEYGGRNQAAAALNVTPQVLRKLGELSDRNDPVERRKVKGPRAPLTEAERQWILAVLPRLTLQAAKIAAGSSPPLLNMADPDLPTL
jgi:hypothetical protein